MALELANLVYQTTTTEGTGNLTLASVTGFQTFSNGRGTGSTNEFPYFIRHQTATEWEVGIGYMSDASTLVRSSVLDSSNAGSLVNFSAGTKNATIDAPADRQVLLQSDGNLVLFQDDGGDILQLVDSNSSTSDNANPYMEFSYTDTVGGTLTRLGYVGSGSIGNSDIFLNNDIAGGNIKLNTNSGYIEADGGVSFSGSDVLNDYETGSFTPTLYGVTTAGSPTYTVQEGIYTKIGNQVTVGIRLIWSSLGGATGFMRIGGFPFSSTSVGTYRFNIDISYYNSLNLPAGKFLGGYINDNGDYVRLTNRAENTSSDFTDSTELSEGGEIYASMTYITA